MVELRWTVPAGTSTKPPKLQWRLLVAVDASGAFCPGLPGEWRDVPFAVVPVQPQGRPIFQTALQAGLMAGDGKPCHNDHDPDCRWPQCNCRTVWA